MDINTLKQEIEDTIYDNTDGDITGDVLREVLLDIADSIGEGGGANVLESALVDEDGLYFVDSSMNIGAQLTQDGFSSFNSINFRTL